MLFALACKWLCRWHDDFRQRGNFHRIRTDYPRRLLCPRLQNLLDARGTPAGRYSPNCRLSLWSRQRKTSQPSSKMLRSRPLKLYKRDVPHVRCHGMDFSRIFCSLPVAPFIPFPSYFARKLTHDAPDKAGVQSRRDEIEPGESIS